jgi:hypothetical protein
MLTSDQLGAKGESRFRELCADAGLICNQSDRDRAGWDFIVEGNYEDDAGTSYDKRATPLACHVQVKTVSENAKPIQMKLNMAERLAKEVKPAFICIFVVRSDLQIVDAYLIHVLGDRLGSILKTLRRHTATADIRSLNKVKITFKPTTAEKFTPNGDGLKSALQAAVGPLLFDYTSTKEKQLRSLGYERLRYRGTIKIGTNNPNELSDMLLGLKTAPVRQFKTFETRFGIEIPHHSSEAAEVQISPQPRDKCRVTVRGPIGTLPVFFDGDVYHAPGRLTGGANRYLIKSQYLTIDIKQASGNLPTTATFEVPHPGSAALSDWIKYWELLEKLSTLPCVVELKVHSNSPRISLPLPLSEPITLPYNVPPGSCLTYAHGLEFILQACAEKTDQEIDWSEVEVARGDIAMLSEALKGELLELSFPANAQALEMLTIPAKTIICNKFAVAETTIGYVLSATLVHGQHSGQMTLSEIKFVHTTKIGQAGSDFEAYRDWAKEQYGVDSVCYVQATPTLLPA